MDGPYDLLIVSRFLFSLLDEESASVL